MCVWSIFHVLSNKRHKKSLCVSIFIMSGSHAIYYPRHFISQNILGIFSYIAHYPAISVKVQTVCPFWDFRLSRTSFIFQYYQYAYVLMGVWSECLSRVYKGIFITDSLFLTNTIDPYYELIMMTIYIHQSLPIIKIYFFQII